MLSFACACASARLWLRLWPPLRVYAPQCLLASSAVAAGSCARTRPLSVPETRCACPFPPAGLEDAKAVIEEAVIWPLQSAGTDVFTGLTQPAKGVLLFGPPGTGKTLIGKAVAHECKATFFSISASSLTSVSSSWSVYMQPCSAPTGSMQPIECHSAAATPLSSRDSGCCCRLLLGERAASARSSSPSSALSNALLCARLSAYPLTTPLVPILWRLQKWIGESEKLVRTLFAVARAKQPSVVFMDEVDSLLTSRGEGEHESSRRVKTEFLVQLDGAGTQSTDFVLIIGATNRPQELDEAARRRFTRRIYVPLPNEESRRDLLMRLLSEAHHNLTDEHINTIVAATAGYSGADVSQVCKAAAMGPLREKMLQAKRQGREVGTVSKAEFRPISVDDLRAALRTIKSSVAPSEITHYLEWDKQFGSKVSRESMATDEADSGAGAGAPA